MSLLIMTILVVLVRGISDAGPYKGNLVYTFVAIGLTIASWLYAPFVFNPYQFSTVYYWDDLKACVGFFLRDGSKHWKENYSKRLEKRAGLTKSVLDVNFFGYGCMLFVWVAVLYHKLRTLDTVYEISSQS